MPVVSVVMANYRCAAYLPAAIASLKSQTLTDWELILVDDASPDDSVAVAEREADGDPRVRIFVQPQNGGPAAARNRALGEARGEWVAIFDSDDLMAFDRLERLVAIGDKSGANIVADNLMEFSDTGAKPFLTGRLAQAPQWIDLAAFVESNTLFSRGADLGYLKPLIRRSVIGQERYDERLRIGEDYDFLARLLARGGPMRLEPAALYQYRRHSSSISQKLNPADLTGLLEANARFSRQHGQQSPAVSRALERRRLSLEAWLVHGDVIAELKAARPARALFRALKHPLIWPLLGRPLKAKATRVLQLRRIMTSHPHAERA